MTTLVETRTRLQRRDALPENVVYRDNGCYLHPSCLTCPFTRCIHDVKGGRGRLEFDARQDQIRRLISDGMRNAEVMALVGVGKRTVQRVKALMRAEGL